eukprot:4597507-Pyramimonas_sp.AAC.1
MHHRRRPSIGNASARRRDPPTPSARTPSGRPPDMEGSLGRGHLREPARTNERNCPGSTAL